jgi:hypothetical protein
MRPEFKEPLEDFLLEGDEDHISLDEIMVDVSRVLHLDRTKWTISDTSKLWHGIQEFIVLMLENGFVAVFLMGDPHTVWPDQTPEGVIKKIKELWIENKGDIQHSVWFYKVPK